MTPFCSTSRVALLTGRYPFRTGWHTHHDAAIYGGGNFDQLRAVTFAQVLRSAGYRTALAGKWQISDLSDPGQADALRRHGFDEHCVFPQGPKDSPAHFKQYWDPYLLRDGKRLETAGRFGPDVFAEFLIDFLKRHRDRPFVAYYASVLTHLPTTPTPLNKARPPESERERFAGMVRYADHDVGRLVAALDELKLRDRTLVFITSDNGNEQALTGRVAGRQAEGAGFTLREGGIDMPFLVNCPVLVPAGRVSERLIDASDVLPTLAELAGAGLPEGTVFDGRSFAATLLGREDRRGQRDWVFSQYAGTRVVRDRRFKLYSTGAFHDLAADPLEKADLSGSAEPPVAAARLKLQRVLDGLPPDARLPFEPRSQSAFQLRKGRQEKRDP
jgi:arylsulfatase A-like enzyme